MVHIVEDILQRLPIRIIFKWRLKYVNAVQWNLGHHTWIKVCGCLQGGPDLQVGADLDRVLAMTW